MNTESNSLLSAEKLEILKDELKNLENSVFMEITRNKYGVMKDMSANMPTYDNESMAKREFYRGVADGLNWLLKDVNNFISQSEQLLQKRKE